MFKNWPVLFPVKFIQNEKTGIQAIMIISNIHFFGEINELQLTYVAVKTANIHFIHDYLDFIY